MQNQTAEAALSLSLALGNAYHKNSDLPEEEIDYSDLELQLRLLPNEIIYQAKPIEALSEFFKVKNMKDYAKIAA